MRSPCRCRCFFRGGACQPQIWMHPRRRTRHARDCLGKEHVVPAALGRLPPSPGAARPISMALEMGKVSEQTTKPGRDHHSPCPTRHAWGQSDRAVRCFCMDRVPSSPVVGSFVETMWMDDGHASHSALLTIGRSAASLEGTGNGGGGIQPGEALFKLADPLAIFS